MYNDGTRCNELATELYKALAKKFLYVCMDSESINHAVAWFIPLCEPCPRKASPGTENNVFIDSTLYQCLAPNSEIAYGNYEEIEIIW